MPIFKENDTAIRIETTKVEILEVAKIRGDKASLTMQRNREVERHNTVITVIDEKIAALDVLITEAERVGVVEAPVVAEEAEK